MRFVDYTKASSFWTGAGMRTCSRLFRDRIISSHFPVKLNAFNIALIPSLPLPYFKCSRHILLNAYMQAVHVDHLPPGTYSVMMRAAPLAMIRSPTHESDCMVDTVKITGSIPDDQQLSQRQPM